MKNIDSEFGEEKNIPLYLWMLDMSYQTNALV